MSLRRHLLNIHLRWIERPRLARATDPAALRRSFERQARFFFRMPRGVRVSEPALAQVPGLTVVPRNGGDAGILFYIHGGGFVFGSPRTHAAMVARIAGRTDLRGCLPQYRLAPEHPFPAGLDDVTTAYYALLEAGTKPDRIVIGGDSAGGALALALTARLIRRGIALPAGVFALSPLTDLTFSGASFRTNARREAVLPAHRASEMARMYLADGDPRDPRASPLFADFHGAPPVWLTCGDSEILLDDTTRMADRLKTHGVAVTCRIEADLPHVWPIFQSLLPEADATLRDLVRWISQRVPPAGS